MSAAAEPMPAIVLLAAGEGRRFGAVKQLASLSGEPMCRSVASQLLGLGCPLLVVTGAHAEDVERALEGLPLDMVRNDDWQRGLGGSIARGARRVLEHRGASTAMLVCLADQPLIDTAHYRRLLERHRAAPQCVLATQHGEVTGPPVLFPADCVAELADWSDPRGAHALLEREAARVERFGVSEHLDVDTQDDLARVHARMRDRPSR